MTSMAPNDAAFRTLYFGFGFENVDGDPFPERDHGPRARLP